MTDVMTLTVWVNDEEKVASFHAEEGYERKDYLDKDTFSKELQKLIEERYRFM